MRLDELGILPPNLRLKVERDVVEALPELHIETLPVTDENVVDLLMGTVHIRVFWEQGYYEAAFGPRDDLNAYFASPDVMSCIGLPTVTLASMDWRKTVTGLHDVLAHHASKFITFFDSHSRDRTRAKLDAAKKLRGLHYPTI